MSKIGVWAFLLFPVVVFSQSLPIPSLINYFNNKAQYITSATDLCSIDSSGISVYTSATAEKNKKPAYTASWAKIDSIYKFFKTVPTQQPLQGLRIAIDPGHIGGSLEMGKIESRFLELLPDSTRQRYTTTTLLEGSMAMATALFLKEKLEAAGATVILTRSKAGYSSFDESFNDWLAKNKKVKQTTPQKRLLFEKNYRDKDLLNRAQKINASNPDLIVIIHYNVNETNTGWNKTTDKNFNMAFIPLHNTIKTIDTPEKAEQVFKTLITPGTYESMNLSGDVVQQFKEKLNVPLAEQKNAKYLYEHCQPTTRAGVFGRNLALTRMVKGVLVYGETLYQDNHEEALLLSKEEIEIGGIKTSKRVQTVAEAYYQGILNFVQNSKLVK